MDKQSITMTDERWNKIVGSVRFALEQGQYKGSNIQDNEINLIVSVLKNNIPFDDCESFDLIDTKVKF